MALSVVQHFAMYMHANVQYTYHRDRVSFDFDRILLDSNEA